MPLKNKLLSVPQRETGGESSESAFGYQKNWAFSELLRFHQDQKDYVFIFEYHDDVLILDSIEPSQLTFIQVKKSDRVPWTINRLLKQESNSTLSIIGKLYHHCIGFSNEIITLKFVSDMHFNFSTQKTISAELDLEENDKTEIRTRINQQIENLSNIDLSILKFEQSSLNFEGHETHLLGVIERFLINYFGNNVKVRASSIYDTFQRIGERSRYSSGRISSFDDLIKRKGVAKKEIDELFNSIRDDINNKVSWEDIKSLLSDICNTPLGMLEYKASYVKMINMGQRNPDYSYFELKNAIENTLTLVNSESTVSDIIDLCSNAMKTQYPKAFDIWKQQDMWVAILICYSNRIFERSENQE